MSVKANWHLDALDAVEYEDPMQVGSRVDVLDLTALTAELSGLMNQEASYSYHLFLECDLKWSVMGPDGLAGSRNPCYTCPHFTTSEDDHLSLLCELGRRQNDVLDAMFELKQPGSLDEELCRHLSDMIESSAELGEALVAA